MTNQPIAKLKDGLLTATIWKNQTSEGKDIYAVTFSRSYLKDEQWQESTSFSGTELLKISRLSQAAYGEVQRHKRSRQPVTEGA